MSTSSASRLQKGCILYFFLYMSHGIVGPFLPLIWRYKGFSGYLMVYCVWALVSQRIPYTQKPVDGEVGLLGSIRPGVSFFAVPAVCALADSSGMHQQVLYALLLLFGISRPLVLIAGSILTVAALEVITSFTAEPANSIVDSGSRHCFGAIGFGKLRTWAPLGLGVASVIGGFVFDAGSGSYVGVMAAFASVTIATIAAATGVPVGRASTGFDDFQEPRDKKQVGGGEAHGQIKDLEESGGGDKVEGKDSRAVDDTTTPVTTAAATADTVNTYHDKTYNATDRKDKTSATDVDKIGHPGGASHNENTIEEAVGTSSVCLADKGEELERPHNESVGVMLSLSSVWYALRTVETASFFAVVVLSGMASSVIDTFLFIRLQELGGSHTLLGISRLIMCLAEVPFFYISGPIIDRIGAWNLTGLAQIGFIARFLYYSVLQDPWWVLPAEVLHGLTFALMWVASIEYAHKIAPAGSETTVVGIVSGLHHGLGAALGAVVGGFVYETVGARLCFRYCAALPSISLFALALPTVMGWLHIRGGMRQKAGITGEQGLEGWGDAESGDSSTQEMKPKACTGRHDKDNGDSGRGFYSGYKKGDNSIRGNGEGQTNGPTIDVIASVCADTE